MNNCAWFYAFDPSGGGGKQKKAPLEKEYNSTVDGVLLNESYAAVRAGGAVFLQLIDDRRGASPTDGAPLSVLQPRCISRISSTEYCCCCVCRWSPSTKIWQSAPAANAEAVSGERE